MPGQYFNNRTLTAPQTEVAVDDTAIQPTATSGQQVNVGILGYSTQGAAGVPFAVTSIDQARQTFGQGPLVDGISRAFSPSPGGAGAQTVYGVRVDAATQSAVTLNDSTPVPAIVLTTRDYGVYTRGMSAQVLTATGVGSLGVPSTAKKVITSSGPTVAAGDNLGYNVLSVTYQGTGGFASVANWAGTVQTSAAAAATTLIVTTATASQDAKQLVVGQSLVVGTGGTKETVVISAISYATGNATLTLSAGLQFLHNVADTVVATQPSLLLRGSAVGSADTAGFPLSNYGSIQALGLAASATSSNWAVVVPTNMNQAPGAVTAVGPSSLTSILDIGNAAVSLAAPGSNTVLTGIAQAVTDWMNGNAQPFFTAVRQAVGSVPANLANPVFAGSGADDATGGSLLAGTLTVTNTDWQNALNALQGVDTPLFVLMSGAASVHALGDAHAAYMSSQGHMERIQVAGGVLGESTSQAIVRAQNLNSFKSCLVYPGIQDFNNVGTLTTYDPFYAAASVAGLAAGIGEANALTNQLIRVQGLEARTIANGGAYTQADYDNLLIGGVMPLQFRPGIGYIIVQSLTTWLQDSRYTKRELSVRRIVDRIARTVREKLNQSVGKNVGPALINQVISDTQAVLDDFVTRGFIVGDAQTPPYQGITAAVPVGRPDTVTVQFQASPAIPANFILVTAHLTAYGTVPTS